MSRKVRQTRFSSKVDIPLDARLREWLEGEAERKRLSVAALVRLLLSEAMEADQSRRKEASS